MEAQLFDESWIGKVISFTNTNTRWRLTEKLRDKNDQHSAALMKDFPDAIGGAYGTFKCDNVDHPTESAIMRIAMQVPYAGAYPYTFAQQASRDLPYYGQRMLDAYSTLRNKKCKSAARLLDVRREQQDDTGMLPGGSILYLLIENAPGKQLDRDGLWDLAPRERERIRQAFKTAWEECVAKGFRPKGKASHLFWDSASGKITFYNFLTSYPTEPNTEWKSVNWIHWRLAKAPTGYRYWVESKKEPDMSDWIL